MEKTLIRGMVFGGLGLVLGLVNIGIRDEAPSAPVMMLTYVLIGLGAIGLLGSLILYVKQKSSR